MEEVDRRLRGHSRRRLEDGIGAEGLDRQLRLAGRGGFQRRHDADPGQRRRLAHQGNLCRLFDQSHADQVRRDVACRQAIALQPFAESDRGRGVLEADAVNSAVVEEGGEGVRRVLARLPFLRVLIVDGDLVDAGGVSGVLLLESRHHQIGAVGGDDEVDRAGVDEGLEATEVGDVGGRDEDGGVEAVALEDAAQPVGAGAEVDGRGRYRHVCSFHSLSVTSRASRRASPKRLRPRTTSRISRPGM